MRREWQRWRSTFRCIWALYTLMKTGLKLQWWIQMRRYPSIEPEMRRALLAIDELFKRDLGAHGSPTRAAFVATVVAVEDRLIDLYDKMLRIRGAI